MAEQTDTVNVKFGAQIDDLKSKLGEVGGLFKELTGRFAAMAAIVAGGTAFKAFIDESNQVNGEVLKLSKTLGITGEEAATLRTALGDVGSDTDTYTSAFQKFNRQLRTNAEGLRELGVDVDAFKSGQKDGNQLFQESIRIIGEYKPGIDQTQVSMKLLGRSAEDAQKLQKLFGTSVEETNKKLEEARLKNIALNLTVTQESLAATKKYKEAMNDVGDVLSGLKKTIGEAVIPVFTESAEALASIGPTLVEGTKAAVTTFVEIWRELRTMVSETLSVIFEGLGMVRGAISEAFGGESISGMQVFKNALGIVHAAFIAFRIGAEEVFNAVKVGVQLLVNMFTTFADVAERALHFDFAGAKAAWQTGMAERNRILEEGVNKAVEIARRGRADLDKALVTEPLADAPKGTAVGKPKGGDKRAKIEDKGAEAQAAAIAAAQLALEKAQAEASLAIQKEKLTEAQQALDDSYKQNVISTKQYFEQSLAITLAGTDAELAAKRKELSDVQKLEGTAKKPEEKLKYAAQEAAMLGQINVLELQRANAIQQSAVAYRNAEQARQDALKAVETGAQKAQTDHGIAVERSNLEALKSLRQISADDAYAIELQLEERAHAANVAASEAKRELIRGDAQKQAELNAELEGLELQHQERVLAIDKRAALESAQLGIEARQSVVSSFAGLFNGLLSGVQKVSDVFRNFGISVANMFTNLISQRFAERLFGDGTVGGKLIDSIVSPVTDAVDMIVRKFITGEATKSAVVAAGTAKRKALEVGSAATTEGVEAAKTGVVVAGQGAQTAAVVAGAATRETTEVAAAATSESVTAGSAIANIGAKAWEAAASVYAAIAAIPYVGPFLAPAAAIAAGAVVLGFASRIVSSAGGDDKVAADRLNFVHKDETILSRPFASGLRKLVGEGGITPVMDAVNMIRDGLSTGDGQLAPPSGNGPAIETPAGADLGSQLTRAMPLALPASVGAVSQVNSGARADPAQVAAVGAGGSKGGPVHFTVHAIDAAGVKKFLMTNGRQVAKSLQNQGRNFVGLKPT